MGGSQSQETHSTIGLPPSSLYRPERTQSLSAPREHSSSVRQHQHRRVYQSNTVTQSSDDSDEWLRVDPTPTTRHAHAPPPPPPPRPHHTPSPDSRPTRREPHPPAHSLREFNDYDLEQLLSTLHSLRLDSRRSSEGVQQEEPGSDRTERRRRQHHGGSSSSGRRSHRLRHPLLFLRPPVPNVKCPLCFKEFPSSELEDHIPACSQRPRVQFNEDKLLQDAGECSICLDDMEAGDEIARLPCLCVYHLHCIRGWYKKSQTCPEHPDMKGV